MSITLGPFAFAHTHLVFILACCATFAIGWAFSRHSQLALGDALFRIIATGLITARLVFVIKYVDVYLQSPWQILNVRDGGFALNWGIAFAAIWMLREWHQLRGSADKAPAKQAQIARVGLLTSLIAGLLVATSGYSWLHHVTSQTQFPTATVHTLRGQPVNLTQAYYGQPAVINLWASWCPPCVREMPLLENAAKQWPDVHIVAINQGEDSGQVRAFLNDQSIELPHVLLDESAQLGQVFGSSALPTTLFFNSDGSLNYVHIGEFSAATLENALRRLQ